MFKFIKDIIAPKKCYSCKEEWHFLCEECFWKIEKHYFFDQICYKCKKYSKNFAYGPALAHHSEVMDMISKAWVVVTDSGSMQEEANIVWVPCVTFRFGSDRIETVLDWTNIIVPPINSKLMADIVKWAIANKKMIKKKHLYGKNVSKKIVDEVLSMLEKKWRLFLFDDERLDLEKFFDWKI